jgi:dihydropteroate synthase
MEYHEAADFLFDLRPLGTKPGTESCADLLAHLGDPHEGLRAVQVAGSNGKGSTARTLESICRQTDLTVGLYTQPHFDDVRERITVDGRPISRGRVAEFVEAAREHVVERGAEGAAPTFFETVTAMAVWEFARQDVDLAVLEVGIGGKLDATSVVDPVASAVTTVSLDHTDVLGETVPEIARDKAHVAPRDRPLVTGAGEDALPTIREVAGEVVRVGGPDTAPDADVDVRAEYGGRVNHTEAAVSLSGDGWSIDTRVPTVGAHHATNAGVAVALARQVADPSDAEVARGVRNAHWPGRFEVLETDPVVVLDGAHNPSACAALAETVAEFDYDDLHLVVGAMHDKDLRGMAAALPDADTVVACQPALDRAADTAVVASVFGDEGGRVREREAVASALTAARGVAGADDLVLVTGSLYTVAGARREWTRTTVPKRLDTRADASAALRDAAVADGDVRRLRDEGVHRALKTRVQPHQAEHLRAELAGLGGECAITGQTAEGELHDVLLFGTLGQFRRLARSLDGDPHGLGSVADGIRAALDVDGHDETRGYPWEDGPSVMGILNVTPDSFHDGGEYDAVDDAVARAKAMVDAGADLVDVGGESTRPGADPVPVAEEVDRVVPVIERLDGVDAAVSVDTRKAAVAEAALAAGADVLNDVSGLEDPEMRFLAAEHDVPIVVMHSVETPVDPSTDIDYDDVVEDVVAQLRERVLLAERAGVDREQILVDPGLGFGKSAAESFELLGRLDEFRALGCPVLVGHSHKSMFGRVGAEHGDRLPHTVAATALAAANGADVIRVHDVAENVGAVRTARATDDPDWTP